MQQIILATVRSSRGLDNWQGYRNTLGSSLEKALFFFAQVISQHGQKSLRYNVFSNKSKIHMNGKHVNHLNYSHICDFFKFLMKYCKVL